MEEELHQASLQEVSEPQALLNKGYSPLHRLGRGGQAVVYKWFHTPTGETVAIKSNTKENPNNHDLAWEANMMKHLHDHIKVDSACSTGVVPFKGFIGGQHLVLGLCDGGSLQDFLNPSNSQNNIKNIFTEQEASKVLKSLATTLQKCHSVGVVHRDIKLDNVFLKSKSSSNSRKRIRDDANHDATGTATRELESYEVVLGDFGLATFVDDPKMKEEVVGTSMYMAPELVTAIMIYSSSSDPSKEDDNEDLLTTIHDNVMKDFDQRMDIWSLGVLLHILLMGEPPFQLLNNGSESDTAADAKWSLFQDILNKPLRFYEDPKYSHLSSLAKDMLSKMLQKKPNDRATLDDILKHQWLQSSSFNHPLTISDSSDSNPAAPPACKRQCPSINVPSSSYDYAPMVVTNLHIAQCRAAYSGYNMTPMIIHPYLL